MCADEAHSTGTPDDITNMDYWTDWIPYNEDVLTEDGRVTSINSDGYAGDTIVLDYSGHVDVLKNVDYIIGSDNADIMIGVDDSNDIFNTFLGEGNFVDGGNGTGQDYLVFEELEAHLTYSCGRTSKSR